jgi:hypothetical protein
VFARTPTLRFLMLTNIVVAAGTAIVLVNSVVYARGVFGLGDRPSRWPWPATASARWSLR